MTRAPMFGTMYTDSVSPSALAASFRKACESGKIAREPDRAFAALKLQCALWFLRG